RLFATGEDRQNQDLGGGKLGADVLNDRGHTGADLFGGIMAAVVLTDHHDGEFRRDAVDVAVVEAPQDVFSAIPANAQIQRVAGGIVAVPGIFALCIVVLDNRVTHIDQIDIGFLGSIIHGLVP